MTHINQFLKCQKIATACKCLRFEALKHKVYRHYTTLDSLLGILKGQSIWLTLGKSAKLNDSSEHGRFGNKKLWKQTYLLSFTHEELESAAMWGLYCKGNHKAVCLSFDSKAILAIERSVNRQNTKVVVNPQRKRRGGTATKQYAQFVDVAYASGKTCIDRVSCDGVETKVFRNPQRACHRDFTGRLKGIEWAFEHETRLIVRLSKAHKRASHIAIDLPTEVLKSMTITLGPWCDNREYKRYSEKIAIAMEEIGIVREEQPIRSGLHDALKSWEMEVNRQKKRLNSKKSQRGGK